MPEIDMSCKSCCCEGNQAPIITNTPPSLTGTECVLWEYFPTYSDAEGDPVEWSLAGTIPAGMTINPATGHVTWTPGADQAGIHGNIRVRVGDNCHPSSTATGAAVITFTLIIADDGCCEIDPPSISSSPNTAATEGVLYQYQVTADDPDMQGVEYCLDVAPGGMSIDGDGLITWTPGCEDAGDHMVTVKVGNGCFACLDGTGAQSQSFTITVANDPDCV
jgi:hypothetical protein